MHKQIIDCSKPIGHPDRDKIIEVDAAEESGLLARAAIAAKQQPSPPSLEDRVAAIEAALAATP